MKKVKIGKFSFMDPVWAGISDDAKDFISQLLTKEQDKRPSAEQALEHKWLKQANDRVREKCEKDLAQDALNNLQNFNASSKLK